MFEAVLEKASLLKKILDSFRDLVEMANFTCTPEGLFVEAMDSSHVALVSMMLKSGVFQDYRCDNGLQLGIKIETMSKILKCAENNDRLTMRANDNADVLEFTFNSVKGDRVAVFDMKLLEIDQDQLGIPDMKYSASVRMPSDEFQRICRDLTAFGDTVKISATKGDVTFSVTGVS